MLTVIRSHGTDDLATVYVAETSKGLIEFAESVNPPLPRRQKWVIILSCLDGCPVRCLMCDAGRTYRGKLSAEEICAQVDYLVDKRFPGRNVPVEKFKIQFTRMGDPAFNPAVLEALRAFPLRYDAPGLIPSVSTIGPAHYGRFFDPLRDIKNALYGNGRFQLQFSIHTTDTGKRDRLIPVPKMSFEEIAAYGGAFFAKGDRKITLNFIVMEGYPIDPAVLARHFDPALFLVKLTPLNPTHAASRHRLQAKLTPEDAGAVSGLVADLRTRGFDVIVSIGDTGENRIGSNCGQYLSAEEDAATTPALTAA